MLFGIIQSRAVERVMCKVNMKMSGPGNVNADIQKTELASQRYGKQAIMLCEKIPLPYHIPASTVVAL